MDGRGQTKNAEMQIARVSLNHASVCVSFWSAGLITNQRNGCCLENAKYITYADKQPHFLTPSSYQKTDGLSTLRTAASSPDSHL